jgi:hypothetical protein
MDCRVKPGNDDPAHRNNDRGLSLRAALIGAISGASPPAPFV